MGDAREQTVLLLAAGRDVTLTANLLRRANFQCLPCSTVEELCREIDLGAGAIILAEEFLNRASVQLLVEALRRQPPWSDPPILVVALEEEHSRDLLKATRVLGAVMILPRPIPVDTLLSAVEAVLSARRRQYEVRDLLQMREEANRRKDEFLAMLGHELRNPLAPIVNATHLLRTGRPEDPFVQRHTEVIERHVRHLSGIVDDLLDVARITYGKVQLRKERILLSHIIEQAAETCRTMMSMRGHEFSVCLPEQPIWVNADALRLVQVFSNLLYNAAKYTEPNGQITLAAEVEGEQVAVRVRDTGIGIPPDLLPHIFETFVQAPRATDRSQGGLGLGLAMVRLLVEMHEGTVVASSEGVGKGSEFTVYLPTTSPPLDQTVTPVSDVSKRNANTNSAAKRRVLVVDDNRDAAETLRELLDLWGYPTEVAHDGVSALDVARRFQPQVVLLDLNLPGRDGYDVARDLRREVCRNGELIVAVTGFAQEEVRQRTREAGFDLHLVKPLNPEALQALLTTETIRS